MPEEITVISQNPPGGRCTLYALYAAELEQCLGISKRVVFSDIREAHGNGSPSMWIKGSALKPADGVILAAEDICAGLAAAGISLQDAPDLVARLDAVLEKYLESL